MKKLRHLCDSVYSGGTAVKLFFVQHTRWFVFAVILVTVLRICIGSERGIQEILSPHDDLLFLHLAHSIANGRWLGGFNSLTLAKGCVFPCYIAVSLLSGLPYLVFLDLTICATAFLGVTALRPALNRFWSLLIYTGLVFNPVYFIHQRVLIQDLLTILLSGMIFCLIACWIRRDLEKKKYLVWIIGAGVFFALLVHLRWEGIAFIVVFLFFYILFMLDMLLRRSNLRGIVIFSLYFILIPLGLYCCVNFPIRMANWYRYGIAEVLIRNNRDYKGFMGSLFGAAKQLDPAWDIRIPVRREILERLYALSPSLKTLKPYLDVSAWYQISNQRFPAEVLKKNPALASNTKGGFVQWQLLDAMSSAGYFKKNNWKETRKFMKQVVRELMQAEAEGKLPGFKPRYSNLPPYSEQMIKWFFVKFSWDAKYLFLWGKKFIDTPKMVIKNSNQPLYVRFYYAPLKNNEFDSRDCYWVLGWGRLPSEKTVVRENNFPRASISFYRTETRKDVQLFLQKSGYSDVPDDAGFSFLARDRHLQVKDNRGQIIYDGDILLKPGSKNVVFDRVKKMRPLSSMKWKRIVVHYICVFCQRGGIYISLLSAMIAIISVLYVFFHNTARRKISDLFCRNHVGGWVHVFLHDHLFQCFDAMPSLSCLFHANDGHAVFCQSGFYSRWTFDLVSGRWSCKKRKRIRLFRDNSGREVDQREHEK